MLLNTITYLCFLAITAAVHYLLPVRYRNGFLLAASVVFLYTEGVVSLLIALCAALITFFFGRKIASCNDRTQGSRFAAAGILLLLLNLCFFKYANLLTSFLQDPVKILFPVGISFYTFASIGYLADVQRGAVPAETDPVTWLLSVLFFPQALSGPIARAKNIIPQLKERTVTPEMVTLGLRRILLGATYKIVLADGLGLLVDGVYNHLDEHSGLAVTMAMVIYPLQLYFDFSGYSSMAVGSALLFGIRLQENFLAPYFSTRIGEIWRRWHISLSEWFRDYLYIPLGGSRKGESRTLLNLMIVFTASALWHGNTWTNLIWGAMIVISRFLERMAVKNRSKEKSDPFRLSGWIKRAGVYLWWMCTMVPFRMDTVTDMVKMVRMQFAGPNLSGFVPELLNLAAAGVSNTGTYYLIYFGSLIVSFAVACRADSILYRSSLRKGDVPVTDPFASLPAWKRWALYWIMGFACAALYIITQTGGGPSFIYQGY